MHTFCACLLAALLLGTATLGAGAACVAGTPRLALTSAAGCQDDPMAMCLSSFSLSVGADCTMKISADSLPDAAASVRLQRLQLAGNLVARNAMATAFPFIGDDVYANCTKVVEDMATVSGVAGDAALAAVFNAIDGGAAPWAAALAAGQATLVRPPVTGAPGCTLTFAVLAQPLDTAAPVSGGVSEAAITLVNGQYAELANEADKTYIAALCPAGTFSDRSTNTSSKTIKTGCDAQDAGFATNKVGATSKADSVRCGPGTYAGPGAAQCWPCDVDMFAPFYGMSVCAECLDGYAPVQGSPRCFAGFGGRTLVTEGWDAAANVVYDPNGALVKIYGDDSLSLMARAGFPLGATLSTSAPTTVAALGGALEGWAAISFGSQAGTGPAVPFLTTCVNASAVETASVLVSEDAKEATISILGSEACGQLNNKTDDIPASFLSDLPDFQNTTSNWQNLTLAFAAPNILVVFGLSSTTPGTKVTLFVTGSTMSILEQTSQLDALLTGAVNQTVTTVANSFGAYVPPTAPSCPAGTSFVEKADSAGVTYSRQCRPCPDGYYCPSGRAGFSPVATACPAGSRATLFGQKLPGQCVPCADGFFQASPGSATCDFCGTALQGATTCPTACPDGFEGNPRDVNGCTACKPGTWRSGDMPMCIGCGIGSQVFKFMGNDSTNDTAIDSRSATGGQMCRPCDPGFFNDNTTVGVCTACAAGSYAPRGGQPMCIPCPAGQWQNMTGAAACKKAAKGTFIRGTGSTVNNATCRPGYFGEIAGAVSELTGCKKCRPGAFSNTTGATACNKCRIGFYQDRSAQTTCIQCPAGTVNTEEASPSCLICAPGSFSTRGSSVCTRCPVGTYQDRAKQSGCKPCSAGSFCPQAGMVAPAKCPVGTYNPRPNGTAQRLACLPCPTGSRAGATKC